MDRVVSLRRVVSELEALWEGYSAYLHSKTGDVIVLPDECLAAAEDGVEEAELLDWETEILDDARNVLSDTDFLLLPDKFDLHEYDIMRRFSGSLEDEALSDELLSLIRGSGAFSRFRSAIERYGLTDAWYRYRAAAIEDIAVDWLEANGIPFERD